MAGPKKYIKYINQLNFKNYHHSPPDGKLEKEFLDNVMLVMSVSESRTPDNSLTEFPSILNSSNAQQFFKVCGILDRRL